MFDYQRKTDGFQRFQVAAYGAGVFWEVFWDGFDKLLESQTVRTFKPPQDMPLARNLIVARHKPRCGL